ncbi:MAG: type IV secretion system DNA-binding domain-containing protein [Candidatus Gracilibacteria bacterium]|nr:type IV secretion system DNA-binding domain-containing protein [Candidatus Gracilibacteria bacterium]MDD3120700.1 type IV secretion system DNA-binding domain-containing protein [Candidatus Gracilibacteria bacterium]MDD4530571.1 type IV secretion system DNA-binding domain-containing protein [Candidatus Gracilibacteria bacterium]
MKNKKVLEISVDRNNEKGPFIFEQILCVLHTLIDSKLRLLYFFGFLKYPDFSFEIANIDGIVKFFLIIEEKYAELLKNQIYAHFPDVEINIANDHLEKYKTGYIGSLGLKNNYLNPVKIYHDFGDRTERGIVDPFSAITSALNKQNGTGMEILQVNFSPIFDYEWKGKNSIFLFKQNYPEFFKKFLLQRKIKIIRKFLSPLIFFFRILFTKQDEKALEDEILKEKIDSFGYSVGINIGFFSEKPNEIIAKTAIKEIASSMSIFTTPNVNGFKMYKIVKDEKNIIKDRKNLKNIILNTKELSGLVHMPTVYVKTAHISRITSKTLEHPTNLPELGKDPNTSPMGITNWRGSEKQFGIYETDRQRHIYIIGKTGMGKSTLLETMIFDDILKGRGVGLIDPHGDLSETILANIPKSRTNDVVIFDPSDRNYPVAFNVLGTIPKEARPLISSGLIGVFKRIFGESWGPRLEHILRNSILTLLEVGNATLINIIILLTNKPYRRSLMPQLKDPMLKKFWEDEFETLNPKQLTEAISPILNKVGQFLSSPILRNILGQPKNSFSLREIMDSKKIFIANLSKGKIGEDSLNLLGSMLITKFQIDAMSRSDIPEEDRKNFYLYVDEFQNFTTDSFTTILSEARKYRLNLIIANQYISQMTEEIRAAVFGNVGTIVSFQVGHEDAPSLAQAFGDGNKKDELISESDLMNIKKYNVYTRMLIEGMPTRTFSAKIFPPIRLSKIEFARQDKEKVIARNREVYGKPVAFVEEKINELHAKLTVKEKPRDEEGESHYKGNSGGYEPKKDRPSEHNKIPDGNKNWQDKNREKPREQTTQNYNQKNQVDQNNKENQSNQHKSSNIFQKTNEEKKNFDNKNYTKNDKKSFFKK